VRRVPVGYRGGEYEAVAVYSRGDVDGRGDKGAVVNQHVVGGEDEDEDVDVAHGIDNAPDDGGEYACAYVVGIATGFECDGIMDAVAMPCRM
jgi:hypothetical protein